MQAGHTANGAGDGQGLPRTCVIGAGACGIAAAKALHARGLPFDCFEMGDRVGGNWVWRNPNGVSSSYRSLHINTSRRRMQFRDFPMDDALPDFPRHDQVAAYLDAYVDRFGFRDRIAFGTKVEHVAPVADRGFDVRLSTGETRRYDAVCVANGHHWDPRWPEPPFPGAEGFAGKQIHAHDYEDESQLSGKRVVVVGMGNSAMDIAVDASSHGRETYLSARRGAHVVPKHVYGRPFDELGGPDWLPAAVRWPMARLVLRVTTGPMERYGLPKPDHRFAEAHPTTSGRVLDRLEHGAITPKPVIERFEGSDVVFADGTRVEADLVVYCTGYRIRFPFFDPAFLDPSADNDLRLYLRVFHPELPRLAFVGFVQPLGAIMPVAEMQAELLADSLDGSYAFPSQRRRAQEIDDYRRSVARRYVASKRHTIQVDLDTYLRDLRRERRRGARRAGRAE